MIIPPEGMSTRDLDIYNRAVVRQRQFEEWAAEQGLLLTPSMEMYCADGRFPAVYLSARTEDSWRAWACKDEWMSRKGYTDGID